MTVKELKEAIKDLPDDMVVLRADNSLGYEAVLGVSLEDAVEVHKPERPVIKALLVGDVTKVVWKMPTI